MNYILFSEDEDIINVGQQSHQMKYVTQFIQEIIMALRKKTGKKEKVTA